MLEFCSNAGVAKLVDALALGASGVIHGGSSPLPGTEQSEVTGTGRESRSEGLM